MPPKLDVITLCQFILNPAKMLDCFREYVRRIWSVAKWLVTVLLLMLRKDIIGPRQMMESHGTQHCIELSVPTRPMSAKPEEFTDSSHVAARRGRSDL